MLVTVATFLDLADAHLLRGRLEAEGIPATVAFEHHVASNWGLAQALGGVAVQVSPSDLEEATALARAHAAGEFALGVDDDPDAGARRICGHCGSDDVRTRIRPGSRLLAIALFLFGGLMPTRDENVCNHCYNHWPLEQ